MAFIGTSLKPLSLLFLLLHGLMATCWTLDTAYGNGVYQFTYNKPGDLGSVLSNITQYKIVDDVSPTPVKNSSRFPKALTRRKCLGGHSSMDSEDLERAKTGLMNWCEQYSPTGKSIIISVFNNATVYAGFLDLAQQNLPSRQPPYCCALDIEYAWNYMNTKCNANGSASVYTWLLERYYGRARKGDRIWN